MVGRAFASALVRRAAIERSRRTPVRWQSAFPAAAHRALTELADARILARTKDQKGKLVCFTADEQVHRVTSLLRTPTPDRGTRA